MLHRDDLAADKVLAMWGRGEPRDYLDVFALPGLYGDEELFALASRKDSGLAVGTFVSRSVRSSGSAPKTGKTQRFRPGRPRVCVT